VLVKVARALTTLKEKSWLTVTTSLGVALMAAGVIEGVWSLAAIAALGVSIGVAGLLRAYRDA
jgi:hypothetical protein